MCWSSEIQKHLAASVYFAGLRQEKSTVPVCVCVCVCPGARAATHACSEVTESVRVSKCVTQSFKGSG